MKANLTDTTFIIHFRRDSEDRMWNLLTILEFLITTIDFYEVLVINDDKEIDPDFKNLMSFYKKHGGKIKGLFYPNDGIYNRCACFKQLADMAQSKILAFYDTDVLVRPEFLHCAQELILQGIHDHVYPYAGLFVDLTKSNLRAQFLNSNKDFDFNILQDALPQKDRVLGFKNDDVDVCHPESLGGCYLISKEAYDRMGGHDPRFIGWGWEDYEFCRRSVLRGNEVGRVEHPEAICWHLHHEINNDETHVNDNRRLAGVLL